MMKSLPSTGRLLSLLAVGLMLSACSSGGPGSLGLPSLTGKGPRGAAADNPNARQTATEVSNAGSIIDDTTRMVLANPKKLTGYCPALSILGDTNIYQSYEGRGTGNANLLKHQATITQTARECTTLGAEMYIKVGIAGRVLAGPKGENSKAVLPLRIVVKQLDEVLYTRLHKIPVKLTPPDRSALFAKVDEAIAIPTPAERNVQILVGFDATSGRN